MVGNLSFYVKLFIHKVDDIQAADTDTMPQGCHQNIQTCIG